MVYNIEDYKEDLNQKLNKFNLKKENEDNLIENQNINEEEDISNINKIKNKLNYKIKYAELLKKIINRDDKEINYDNEFICNILLMPSQIELSDKISTLSMLSYCYQTRENSDNIYLIANKFEKNFDIIRDVDINFFIKVFCRAAVFLQKQENFFYAYKYIKKCLNLIKNNISTFAKKIKKAINEYYTKMESDFKNYIKEKEELFKDPNCKPKCQKIKKLIDSIISEIIILIKKKKKIIIIIFM